MDSYNILNELGAGSYGAVSLAIHKSSETKCVLKEIKIVNMTEKDLAKARQEVEVCYFDFYDRF